MRLVYNVYDDENQIESKQFDNFPEALEYAKQGLITYICEEDLDCPDCEERVVWTWDSTWDDEEAISNVACEKQDVEPCVEDGNDNIEITISGPAEEVESLIDLIFDDAFDLDWDTPVEETKVEEQDFADEFGYEDEPAAKDLDFDVENPFENDLYNLERDLGEDDLEIGEPEIVVDSAEESKEDQLEKLVEETEEVDEEEIEDETEEILTTVEEIKEIAAEAGEAIASVYEDKPMLEQEEIKEITDEVVENKLEEQSEDELSEEELEELDEELLQEKRIPTYTLKELEDEIERDSLTIDTEEERSETIGLSGTEIRISGSSDSGYHVYEVLYDTDGEEFEGDDLEDFDNIVELASYLDDAGYIKVTDLDQYLEECVSKETKISEATHAQYAKPEGDKVAAYNNALKYAKKNNADYIYGYTNHSGKFFALEQPIKMSEKIGETEKEFRNKYKNCSTVYVAYRDKDFIESVELDEADNAVVNCKIADVVTHSEDEKPLDETIKMTKDELLDKEGTTDVDLINAGRPEEERVELVESDDFYQPDRELVGYVIVDIEYGAKYEPVYFKKGWEKFSRSYLEDGEKSCDDEWYDQIITEDLDEVELYDSVEEALETFEDFISWNWFQCTKRSGKNSLLVNWAGQLDFDTEKPEVDEYVVKPLYHYTQSWNELDEQLKENCKIDESKLEDAEIDLAESVSQEISNAYKQLSKEYGRDIEELVYGPNGFMATKYPNGLPDFRGDIIYSDKYWAEFEEWLEAQDQIKEDLEDDLTDQEFAEQLQARLKEADVNSTNAE